MSATNGHAPSLPELREQIEVLRARRELRALQVEDAVQSRLLEAVYPGYTSNQWGEFVDPYDSFRDSDLRVTPLGVASRTSRQDGYNRPFVWAEIDLDAQRDYARWCATKNQLAVGAVESLADYTVRQGFSYEARPAPSFKDDATARALAAQVQDVVDEFQSFNLLERNGEQYAWADREWDSVHRSVVDGEVFVRVFDQDDDGLCLARFVEPEQIRQPLGSPTQWSLGVRTDPRDVERAEAYAVSYAHPDDWEEVSASEVCHLAWNKPSSVKRGLSDFYPVGQTFDDTAKMVRNCLITGGVQSAIAWIEQFDAASPGVLQSHVNSARDQQRPQFPRPFTGKDVNYQKIEPGSIPKVGAGRTYVPQPAAVNAASHTQTIQSGMRALGARWRMPEYMISADASNANYASTLVAGAPFVVRIECRQARFGRFFVLVMWKGPIRAACRAGRFKVGGRRYSYEDVSRLVDVVPTPPKVAISDSSKESAEDLQDVQAGVMSIETRRERRGLDNETEERRVKAERAAKQAQQGGGEGQGGGGGDGNGGLAGLLGESLALEVTDRVLMEAGFTGTKTVTVRGKEQTWHYRDGKRVAAPKTDEGGEKPPPKKASPPEVAPTGHPEIDGPLAAARTPAERALALYDSAKHFADLVTAGEKAGDGGAAEAVKAALAGASESEVNDALTAVTGFEGPKMSREKAQAQILDFVGKRIGSALRVAISGDNGPGGIAGSRARTRQAAKDRIAAARAKAPAPEPSAEKPPARPAAKPKAAARPAPKPKAEKPARLTVDQAHDLIKGAGADVGKLTQALLGLTGDQIGELRAKLGHTKGSGTKQKRVDELVAKVVAGEKPSGEKKAPAKPAAKPKPKKEPAKKGAPAPEPEPAVPANPTATDAEVAAARRGLKGMDSAYSARVGMVAGMLAAGGGRDLSPQLLTELAGALYVGDDGTPHNAGSADNYRVAHEVFRRAWAAAPEAAKKEAVKSIGAHVGLGVLAPSVGAIVGVSAPKSPPKKAPAPQAKPAKPAKQEPPAPAAKRAAPAEVPGHVDSAMASVLSSEGVQPGDMAPADVGQLRDAAARLGVAPEDFDRELFRRVDAGQAYFNRHNNPGLLSPEQRARLLRNPDKPDEHFTDVTFYPR